MAGLIKKCKKCKRKFKARDKSNIYCKNEDCVKARRKAYMSEYMVIWKKQHPKYWQTKKQYEYLKNWRKAHPDYFKNWGKEHKNNF